MKHRKALYIITWVLCGVLLVIFLTRPDSSESGREAHRSGQVRLVDWNAVDPSVREVFIRAQERSEAHAGAQVRLWSTELRARAEDNFLPWYFGYWNQQALSLKTAGWLFLDTPPMRSLTGGSRSARERIGELIEKEFRVRVLHPVSANRRVEAITRESVKIYLQTLSEGLHALQADYRVRDPQWSRYLEGLSGLIGDVEANRQIPLLIKAGTVAGGAAAVSVTRMVIERIRMILWQRTQRELAAHSLRSAGRTPAGGLAGPALAGFALWDLYDHHRTVRQNLPVLRRLLHEYFDQLEHLVLHDPETGIFLTLEQTANRMIGSFHAAGLSLEKEEHLP